MVTENTPQGLRIQLVDQDGRPTFENGSNQPMPYTKKLHTQVEEGTRKGKDGVSQMGTAEAKAGNGRGGGWLRPGNDEQEIKIRDMPVPQLPEK